MWSNRLNSSSCFRALIVFVQVLMICQTKPPHTSPKKNVSKVFIVHVFDRLPNRRHNATMTRHEELKALHEHHHADCECGLKKTATRPVFGDGNPDARIVFIGEAPGKKEDETGVPFVGAAGKFLAEMLANIGMQ